MLNIVDKVKILVLFLLELFFVGTISAGVQKGIKFSRLDANDGLSNSQVNCIFKDSKGFMWFGTQYGLNRYDGFRVKTFFKNANDTTSVGENFSDDIQEAYDGKLWIKQGETYCVYNPVTESFCRTPARLLQKAKIKGYITYIYIDKYKNFWVFVSGKGCYFYNPYNETTYLFKFGNGKNMLPKGTVSTFGEYRRSVLLAYNDGTIICLSGAGKKVMWKNHSIIKMGGKKNMPYRITVDSKCNYWVITENYTFIYSHHLKRWFSTINELFKSYGFKVPSPTILVKDIAEDYLGRMWIATEHYGLFILDAKKHELSNYLNSKDDDMSISDNTQQSLYQDKDHRMWIGTYKNGVNMYSEKMSHFNNIALGDINTIAEDKMDNYWIGTNNDGIKKYNPYTGDEQIFNKTTSGFSSNTIVCSYVAHDGSLWFGTYEGGLIHYKGGHFTNYKSSNSKLANNNVWAVTGDRYGYIWVGLIEGGIQRINPKTGEMKSLNQKNSGLASNYISSLTTDNHGNIIAGTSFYYSVINPRTFKVTSFNVPKGSDIQPLGCRCVQAFTDSRGLVWIGTDSGMLIYDSKNKKLYLLDRNNGLLGSVVCSVTEDLAHRMWIVTERGVANVCVDNNEGWQFHIQYYNYKDGLQIGPYNQRSVCRTRNGVILVGGQEGLDIINPSLISHNKVTETPMFSGLILYDHDVNVGETYNGRVILDRSLNENRHLVLKHSESVFTILLSSDNSEIHNHAQFMYKLDGLNDNWIKTNESRPDVQFMSLAPGKYTLMVKIIGSDGNPGDKISKLTIEILPPFYASSYAYAFYILLIIALAFYGRRYIIRRQQEKFKIETIRREAEKSHEIDEVKLKLFTNISHELRTPLTLIITPIKQLIKMETDAGKRNILVIICRNAMQLLTLVNQLLDFRKSDLHRMTIKLCTGDIVKVIKDAVSSFSIYQSRNIAFEFHTDIDSLTMSFDEDKIGKIVKNLVNNAYKFSRTNGKVSVSLSVSNVDDKQLFNIVVADKGIGISDDDKKHIFERFYQSGDNDSQTTGGSGVGLNIVHDFVEMHKGTITVTDNDGGGTVFTVSLPVVVDATAPIRKDDDLDLMDDAQLNQQIETMTVVSHNPKSVKDYKVLIVDDSEDFLLFISEVLSEDYKVSVARNGKEALEKISDDRPDIVLSDVMMPVMDGNELCRKIKDNPETENIPVIMLTARLAEEHKKESLMIGADDYITKPFDIDLLNLRISKIIAWSRHHNVGEKHKPEIKQMEITSLDEQLINDATQYVEDNLSADISVEAMSEALNMSRVHLYKKMVAITGTTPSEFIRSIRLRYAEQLLTKSQRSISEIAYTVGFNSPRIFSKYFKDMYGVQPSQYKKKDDN
nr:response regulator [Prevotella sp.]